MLLQCWLQNLHTGGVYGSVLVWGVDGTARTLVSKRLAPEAQGVSLACA